VTGALPNERIEQLIRDEFPDAVLESAEVGGVPTLVVRGKEIVRICAFLKERGDLGFDYPMSITAVEWPESFEVVYHLYSIPHRHYVTLKVKLPKEKPSVASVTSVWKGANWQEREVYDMFGIEFEGHPDPRRILTDEGFEGFPLRKDFVETD
jgi:NADH-quinone oxidoreductase subunit C